MVGTAEAEAAVGDGAEKADAAEVVDAAETPEAPGAANEVQ